VGAAARDGEGIATALGRAAAAANAGMRATRPLIARRGLALRLGERSRGNQDPGATSCFLLVRAMLPHRRR
jgi:phosphoenolpyruvate---glycerone phosphotransferase subunit DhaL